MLVHGRLTLVCRLLHRSLPLAAHRSYIHVKYNSCSSPTTALPGGTIAADLTLEKTKEKPSDELFIYETGNGEEPVILLHDLASTHQYWFLLLPHLNQHKFKYLVPDLLGHGRSPQSRHLVYDMDTHIRYLYRDILDGWSGPFKRVKKPIGHGMGAIIALELGCRFPNLVDRITLINLPYFEKTSEYKTSYKMVGHVCYYNKFMCFMSTILFRYTSWLWIPIIPLFTRRPAWLVRDCMRYTTTVTYSSYKNVILGHKIDNSAKHLANLSAYNNVTLIHGDNNTKIPLKCSQRFFQKYPELCQLDIFQDAGHNLPLYQAKELANQLNKEILS